MEVKIMFKRGKAISAKIIIISLFFVFLSFNLFSAHDTNSSINDCGNITLRKTDNTPVKFSEFKGENLLVVFWSPRCSHCIHEIPNLIKLKDEYGDKLRIVSVLEINYDKKVQKFIEDKKLNYPVFKYNYKLEECLGGVKYFPTLYFLNNKLEVKKKLESFHEYEEIKGIIDSL